MIVVTGGAGFIGSNLILALEERGENDILVCEYLGSKDEDIKWKNLNSTKISNVVTPKELFKYTKGFEKNIKVVFHLGAISNTTEVNSNLLKKNNFLFTIELWKWCALNDIQFIYASSAATYGDGSSSFDDDYSNLNRLVPLNLYAKSKHLSDIRIRRLISKSENIPPQTVGLKFFNVYGPNESHKGSQKSMVSQAFNQIRTFGNVKLFSSHNREYENGEQLRDFIHVDDCVDTMIWLFENCQISGLFNLGTGIPRTFVDLANAVFNSLDLEVDIQFIDIPENIRNQYQYYTCANMSRLRSMGLEKNFMSLEEGVKKFVDLEMKNIF